MVDMLERPIVHRPYLARLHRGHLVRRLDRLEYPAGELGRCPLECLRGREEAGTVAQVPLPLASLQEAELLGECVRIQRRLDLEDLDARVRDELAHPPVRVMKFGVMAVHERAAVQHRLDVVVMAEALVGGEAGGDRLVAAVHRDEVDVDVDEKVRLDRPLVELDVLAVIGLPEVDQVGGILRVVLGEQAVRREGVEDPLPERVSQLVVGHAAVEGERRDEHDVVDSRLGRQVEYGLDDALADIRRLHRGQRERDVVESDRQFHARAEQCPERGAVTEWVLERVADGGVGILQRR